MSMSKKNSSLLFIFALVLIIALFAVMFTVSHYAGAVPWSFDSHFVAHCAGSSCTIG